MEKRVAYYAHHQGSGHMQHATDFADTVDCPLLILSTRSFDTTLYPNVSYEQLPDDNIKNYVEPEDSVFHYAPSGEQITARFARIANALQKFKPDVVIIDVSVEVAVFVKLLGYPVVYRLMHGDRTDQPHELVFRIANKLLAYYPKTIEQKDRKSWVVDKTFYVGMKAPCVTTNKQHILQTITVLTSTGGEGVRFSDIQNACNQTPDWNWVVLGKVDGYDENKDLLPKNCEFKGLVNDPDTYLSQSKVIISSSGHNAVARSVAHAKPLILVPETRPFSEQARFAEAISEHTDITYVSSWSSADWASELQKAKFQDASSSKAKLLVNSDKYGHNIAEALKHI